AYGLVRFVIDYFRMPISASDFAVRLADTGLPAHFVQSPLNLIPSQLYSLAMVVGGALFLLVVSRRSANGGPLERDEQNDGEGRRRSTSMRRLRKKIR
ncbi:MAG: hypothetical protein ACOCY8_07370, partial [Spirochaetota bacterium]